MGGLLLIVVGFAVYFVPSIVAFKRDVRNPHGIGVVNLFLGWTLIGWVVALAWACSAETEDDWNDRRGH